MEITITKPTQVNVKTLEAYLGNRFYAEDLVFYNTDGDSVNVETTVELLNKFPSLEKDKEICLIIDVDSGKITNWPIGWSCEFYSIKLVDEGRYKLYDDENNLIHEYDGYVPDILEIAQNGYGDYLEFEVNKNGYIEDWECTDDLIQDFMEQQ
mgnify:CR=1 FL=1